MFDISNELSTKTIKRLYFLKCSFLFIFLKKYLTMNLKVIKRALYPLLLLLIPLFGNLFSNQVNWSLFDFIVMGFLLVLTGLSIHFIIKKVTNKKLRIVPIIFVIIIFLMIWAELAIGVFGSPIAGI
jgi:hypothetical protein